MGGQPKGAHAVFMAAEWCWSGGMVGGQPKGGAGNAHGCRVVLPGRARMDCRPLLGSAACNRAQDPYASAS